MVRSITFAFLGIIAFMVCSCGTKTPKDEALVLWSQIDRSAPPNTLTDKEKQDGWQLLFNGKDSTGWHGYNMTIFPDCWTIEDGCFTMTTLGGAESQDIITDKVYKNFAFSAEFKLTPGANSGIIFQVKEDTAYKYPYETGPEFQVIDHEGWTDKLEDYQICGANYAMNTPMARPYRSVGEWNQAMVIVDSVNVTFILNDSITVRYTKYSDEWTKARNSGKWANFPDYGKYDEGHISLQNHGTSLFYRNIKLKEL